MRHYVISFNEEVENPIEVGLSSGNTDRLTDDEILELISNPPEEEIHG